MLFSGSNKIAGDPPSIAESSEQNGTISICEAFCSSSLPAVRTALPSVESGALELLTPTEKAAVLIEALGWIRQFRDKVTVIKLGGSLMDDVDAMRHLLIDIVFMETVGMRPVVVHGGGAAINRAMDTAGLTTRFIQGRRYTDVATCEIVERVLAYETNEQIAQRIEEFGGRAVPLNFRTTNVLWGERLELEDEQGNPIDLGAVGDVTRVDRSTISNLCYAGTVPVIPSMCLQEKTGEKLNVNADTAATAVAQAMGAEKLIFMSDVNGVRQRKDDPTSLVNSLTASQARAMIRDGAIETGMIPKVEACLETLGKGIRKIHIIDGRERHGLLLEIYTNKGVGTEIVKDP
ncbi:MAG: acetylglutamate kinase [Planctomycetia bacterium]|nr:acetylglutamate kinase [Planctomycetia bacterium]